MRLSFLLCLPLAAAATYNFLMDPHGLCGSSPLVDPTRSPLPASCLVAHLLHLTTVNNKSTGLLELISSTLLLNLQLMLCTVLHRGVCSSVASATPAGELSVVERVGDPVGLIWYEDLGCLSDNICGRSVVFIHYPYSNPHPPQWGGYE
jgi:hypothetical protein